MTSHPLCSAEMPKTRRITLRSLSMEIVKPVTGINRLLSAIPASKKFQYIRCDVKGVVFRLSFITKVEFLTDMKATVSFDVTSSVSVVLVDGSFNLCRLYMNERMDFLIQGVFI